MFIISIRKFIAVTRDLDTCSTAYVFHKTNVRSLFFPWVFWSRVFIWLFRRVQYVKIDPKHSGCVAEKMYFGNCGCCRRRVRTTEPTFSPKCSHPYPEETFSLRLAARTRKMAVVWLAGCGFLRNDGPPHSTNLSLIDFRIETSSLHLTDGRLSKSLSRPKKARLRRHIFLLPYDMYISGDFFMHGAAPFHVM